MAQIKENKKAQLDRTMRRMGLAGSRGVVLTCVSLALVVALCSVIYISRNTGVVLDRNEEGASSAEVEGSSQGDSPGSSTQVNDNGSAQTAEEEAGGSSTTGSEQDSVTVHVDGAVVSPGVYTLVSPARTVDAVEAAGGLTTDADTVAINLAQTIEDGAKVHVPLVGEEGVATTQSGSGGSSTTGGGSASEASSGGTSTTSSKVNINTATAEELTTLPGVGPSTAQAIIEDRQKNGKFTSAEDLMRVSGIGEKKFAKMKDYLRV